MILAISPLVDVDRPLAPRFGLYEAALTLIGIRDGFECARDDGMVRAEHLLAQDGDPLRHLVRNIQVVHLQRKRSHLRQGLDVCRLRQDSGVFRLNGRLMQGDRTLQG